MSNDPDERTQIAFRLAHQLSQKSIYGIDEQSNTIDCFPFDKVDTYAKAHQQSAALGRMQEKVAEMIKQMEAAQKTKPVRLMLADVNDPARILSDHQNFYYALLSLGNEKDQPGAELNAAWYQRNAKIFAKLTQIAQPGGRLRVRPRLLAPAFRPKHTRFSAHRASRLSAVAKGTSAEGRGHGASA